MATTRDANNFFEEDDEETLRDLVEGDSEVSSRLETFAKRFLVDNDHKDASSPWSALVDAVNGLGFHLDEAIHAGPSLTESSGPLPAAFESEDGKKHLAATAALLNVSEKRAVKLTMSSLRSLDEASITNLQALLGTRSLVKKVMEYYFKQRVARVAIITECLRKEQDPDTADHSTIVQALDTLDATYTNERNHRGLFRFLLSIFGQKIDSYAFSRGQQHIKELRRDTPISLQESFAQFSPEEADRRRFLADCQELNKRRNFQEQTEAMEALIVLLYNRIQGGVGRTDLMMMLIAFHSTNTINESPEEERLSQLTGIIYTECMGLWRVFDGDSADGVDWVVGHPLLRGIIPSREDSSTSSILVAAAEKELEALMKVLLKHVDVVGNKKVVSESVGLLSFGILSLLAYNAILASPQGSDENGYWQVLGTKGEELVRIGSDKQALDCFRSTMESLVSSPARKADSEDNLSYDWLSLLADTRTSPMAICEGQDIPEMDANSLTYASIGNELLNGMTMALQDTILHVEHDYACQNIAMVCEMAACIYRNSPSLCEPFWIDWSEFTSATRPPKRLLPMCRVVDSAYLLVSNALQVDLKGPGLSKQQLLATLAPLLRLISSISYNADSVEAAFGVIPTSLLQKALLICAAENQPDDSSYHDQKWSVLYSISMLTRVGDSDSCRTMIRDALSGEGNTSVGPRILLRALSKAKESSQDAILDILADLMKGAPVKWVLAFEQALKMPGLLKVIEEKPVGLPLARLFKAFSLTTRVLFSHVCNDTDGENLLAFIWRGVLKLSRVVPLSMSNVSREKVPLTTLRAVFSFFATLLKNITPIMVLHKSVKVQSVARGIRDALIEMLSSSLGEVVLFYALLPISSSIGESLETYSQERSIIQCASMAEDDLSKNKYGMWHMAATRKIEAVAEDSTDASHVKVLVTNANIDFEGACQIAGYSEDELLGVAGRALSLLQLWARHVDDMLLSDGVSLDFEKKSKLMSISPSKYLTENAIAPHSIRGKDQILSLWDCAHPSNLQLLARYLDIEDGDSASWPLEMKALALDFMCACVDHVKRASPQEQGVGDTAIFKVLKKYTEVVGKYTERALDVITDDEADGNHMKKGAKTLGLLAKRFLCSVAETGAFLSADDNPNITQLITRFSKEIREVSDELYQAREARGAVFLEDDPLLQKLQSATGSLSFFNALWAYETSSSVPSSREGSHSMKKYIDEERGTVSKLSQVVLQHARLSEGDGAKGKNEGRCILFAFLTNAVDFLRLGTQICSDNTTENFSISLLKFWEEDAFEFLCMPRQFCSVDAPIDVAEAIKGLPLSELGARTVISNPFALLQVFPLLASSQNALPGCFCLDTTSAANLVDGLTSQRYSLDDINVKVFGLTVSRHLLSSQLALLRSWAEFSCVLLPLTSKRERASASFSGTPTDALSEPRRSLLQSAYHSLEVLQENLRNNETSCVDGVDLSCCEVGKMADQMAGMVLQVVVKGMEDTVSSPDMLVDLLQLVSLCAVKLFGMLQSNADECCTVQQQLLATSIGILDIVESVGTSFSGAQPKISHDTVSNLVMATSQVLRLMETPAAIRTDVKHKSLQTCIVLLSVLTAKSLDAAPFFGEKGLFRSVLSKRFDDLELLPMLVRQGHLYSSTFETQRTHAANPSVATRDAEENTVGVVVSVFDIILTISQQADFLAQLNLSGAFQMLLGRNPLFSRSGGLYDRSRKMRGYVPTQEKVWPRSPSGVNAAFFAGKDDPVHLLWQKALLCCTSALASKRNPVVPPKEKERIQSFMSDFISAHWEQMISCLRNIESSSFTKNSLSEASLILSLLSEFCKKPCSDRRAYHAIYNEFLPIATSLIGRIGSFLGSSATAREFFNAVADDEASDSEVDVGSNRLSPFGRVQNARHEAIRYSHYASRFCTAVTREDFETSSQYVGAGRSASGLEHQGRTSMTCKFERSMEMAAAECMYFAASLLFEVHPANSCFFMFSEQSQRIDAMLLVKEGMVIAFVSESGLHFAEVIHCNTVNREFYVRNVRLESTTGEIVKEKQIVGLEDISKRRCHLALEPAPDTASELEGAPTRSHLGHIVLALRWCADCASVSNSFVTRFAEQLSILLSTELSLHSLIGSTLTKPKESVEKLNLQLLDLYGDASDGDDATDGRLKTVLGHSCWDSVRQQLKNELKKAQEFEQVHNAKMDDDSSGIFFGAVGRSSNRNPFDELRMDYD